MYSDDPMIDECAIVAVIDSDVLIRNALRGLPERAGLTVTFFESTEEYLRASRHSSCIVLDPGSDGLDIQSRFAKMNCRTPIVFVTANDNIRMSVRAMKAGAIEYFTKPFRNIELLDAVRSGTNRRIHESGRDDNMRKDQRV